MKWMVCLNCNKNKAVKHPVLGWLNCLTCSKRQKTFKKPDEAVELVGATIKEQRKEYAPDILQKWKGDGTLSKEYIKHYGTKGLTKEQIAKSKNVWGLSYYNDD